MVTFRCPIVLAHLLVARPYFSIEERGERLPQRGQLLGNAEVHGGDPASAPFATTPPRCRSRGCQRNSGVGYVLNPGICEVGVCASSLRCGLVVRAIRRAGSGDPAGTVS